MERSEKILQGLGNQYYRATLKSMGFTTEDLKRPVIGIANAWSECVPGHYNLRQVAQRVKDGIYRAGGTPIEFGVIGGCDGMGQGHDGMHYILPSRELIANSIESMAQINLFDGLVLLGSCDKIVPGMLMAAARLDIPCIFLPGGPMEGGAEFDGRQADQTSSTEAYGMLSAGKITEAEYVTSCETIIVWRRSGATAVNSRMKGEPSGVITRGFSNSREKSQRRMRSSRTTSKRSFPMSSGMIPRWRPAASFTHSIDQSSRRIVTP